MELEELIGQSIVRRRKELNLSQEALAKNSGIDRRYLSDIEHGTRSVSITILKSIARQLKWTMTELMSKSEPMTQYGKETVMGYQPRFSEKLGKTIIQIRLEENMSQELFSKILGLKLSEVQEIEAGSLQIPLDLLEKIAIAFRMTTSDLLLKAERSE